MADYRIMGRIEKRPEGAFRAVVCAVPDRPGAGPEPGDMDAKMEPTLEDCRFVLGRMVHAMSSSVMGRGDQVVWLDVH